MTLETFCKASLESFCIVRFHDSRDDFENFRFENFCIETIQNRVNDSWRKLPNRANDYTEILKVISRVVDWQYKRTLEMPIV